MLADGEYTIEVSLKGGSGKSGVASPANLSVKNGKMQAEIEWSSSNYDYMEIDGEDYYPINTEGNSLFLVSVAELDTDIPVKAETLAMSEPHLIEYTLNFNSSTAISRSESSISLVMTIACTCAVAVAVAMTVILIRKKKMNDKI